MGKTLKFRKYLSELILRGEKDSTWRLFDDKDLCKGDTVSFLIWETGEEFAKAVLLDVKEKTFGELTADDWEGHEKFSSEEEMYATYTKYYVRQVTKDSPVKIIKFALQD
jgi:hypothetical protein